MLIFLFIAGFIILIKGADMLVEGASGLARKFHISDLVIGLTVVAFGKKNSEVLYENKEIIIVPNLDLSKRKISN
ncbi:MAG: hypothetical protein ABII23_06665 [bacterium]